MFVGIGDMIGDLQLDCESPLQERVSRGGVALSAFAGLSEPRTIGIPCRLQTAPCNRNSHAK